MLATLPPVTEIDVVLFDLGGVVCPFDHGSRLHTLAADCGLTADEVDRRVWRNGLARAFDAGEYTSEQWYAIVRDRLGLRMDRERFEDVVLGALSSDAAVLAIVDAVRGHRPTALLTDNPPLLRDAMATRFPEVVSRFEPMLFSCDLRALKPSPEAFAAALARLGRPPERVLFIDDTSANVDAARALGMAAIHYTGAEALRAALSERGLIG